jgi:pyruvate/2-oxoglutarate dehydrogenase complex dihydrolipoamide dehydrogenase (E3) component
VIENIKNNSGHVNYATIPGVIYTHPELAQVTNLSLLESEMTSETLVLMSDLLGECCSL